MGDGANRVLAGVKGSFCEGRLSITSGLEAVDRALHLQRIQDLVPETMVRLGTIITYQPSFVTVLVVLVGKRGAKLGIKCVGIQNSYGV